MLSAIQVPVVILTGSLHRPSMRFSRQLLLQLLSKRHIKGWFVQNIDQTIPRKLWNHTKLHPYPYGLPQTDRNGGGLQLYREYFINVTRQEEQEYYKQQSRENPQQQHHARQELNNNRTSKQLQRQTLFYFGYIRRGPHLKNRKYIPRDYDTPRSLDGYYQGILNSTFVISPNGDRPECYRHYEALGLGAIPLTELNPRFYPHLRDGPIVYYQVATTNSNDNNRKKKRNNNKNSNNKNNRTKNGFEWKPEVLLESLLRMTEFHSTNFTNIVFGDGGEGEGDNDDDNDDDGNVTAVNGTMPFHPNIGNDNEKTNTTTMMTTNIDPTYFDNIIVNRNLVLEEYWMEYIDFTVGVALRWWHPQLHRSSRLYDIIDGAKQ